MAEFPRSSWIDRIKLYIKGWPFPYPLSYLLLFALHGFINHLISWVDGWLSFGSWEKLLFLFPLWTWGPIAIITYLDNVALDAIEEFSALMKANEEEIEKLQHEFTHLPRKAVIISGLFWTVIYAIQNYFGFDDFYGANAISGLGLIWGIFSGIPAYLFGSILAYYVIRLLRLVSKTLNRVKSFDIFRLGPVYAFSRLTAQTGISIIAMLSLTLLIYPIDFADFSVWAVFIFQMTLAIAAFILPLRSVNLKLSATKKQLVAEHQSRTGIMLSRLNQAIDSHKFGEISDLENALNTLVVERSILKEISTWPWRSQTLKEFVSAIFLPLLIWAVQQLASAFF